MKQYRIAYDRNDGPMTALARVIKQRIETRWDTEVIFSEPADLTLEYTEGNRFAEIRKTERGYTVSAAGAASLWDAAGRILRSAPAGGTFVPCPPTGFFRPLKDLCGMYFATHFFNFYHSAPLEEIKTYIEDLALWGMEALGVWFDMHHYTGMQDPEAVKMASRLTEIQKYARSLGLKLICTTLANEGFSTTPEELKATNAVQNGYYMHPDGFYHTEICPNKEGGLEQILKNRTEMLDVFGENKPDYFIIWPYDQGGCTCEKCAPWGSCGFLKTAKALSGLIRKKLPDAKIILSTWYFGTFYRGNREWDDLYQAFDRGELDFVDYIMADFPAVYPEYVLTHPQPRPLLSFNEFSMYGANPWGAYGSNPMPDHILEQWNDSGKHLAGGMPYSEGIFEDINKAITLRLFRDGQDPTETIREYLRYECGIPEQNLDRGLAMIRDMETGLYRDTYGYQTAEKTVTLWHSEKAEEADQIAAELEQSMSEAQKNNLKWRQIRLRTQIDAELVRNQFRITEKVIEFCTELDERYHTQNGSSAIRPLTEGALDKLAQRVARPTWKAAPTFWWEQ